MLVNAANEAEMNFLGRFLMNFAIAWVIAMLAYAGMGVILSLLSKQNLDIFRDDAYLTLGVIIPLFGALVIGLARAFGWKG